MAAYKDDPAPDRLRNSALVPARVEPTSLTRPIRIAACVLGLAGLGAGGVAVYIRTVEAGPVAMLALGFIFLLIGISGRLPNRVKLGENEAEWQREASELVASIVEEAPVDNSGRVVDDLNQLALLSPELATEGLRAVSYKMLVIEILRNLSAESRGRIKVETWWKSLPSGNTQRIDAAISVSEMFGTIVVYIRSSSVPALPDGFLRDFDHDLHREAYHSSGFDKLLLITSAPLDNVSMREIRSYPAIAHVVVTTVRNSVEIAAAIDRLVDSTKTRK